MCQVSRHSFGHGGRLSEGGACRAVAPSEGGSEPNRRQAGPSEAIKKSNFFQCRAFAAVQSSKFKVSSQAIQSNPE